MSTVHYEGAMYRIFSVRILISRHTPRRQHSGFASRVLPLVFLAALLAVVSSANAQGAPRYMPGLYASDVYLNLEHRGFSCHGPTVTKGGVDWLCTESVGVADYQVEIFGATPGELEFVDATAVVYNGPVNGLSKSVLGFVATLPYTGSQPQAARAWVEAHLGTSRLNRVIAGVAFTVYGGLHNRVLEMSASGSPFAPTQTQAHWRFGIERASSGNVAAELSYELSTHNAHKSRNVRIRILRHGTTVFEETYKPLCSYCGVFPASLGYHNSVALHDLEGDQEPEVIVDLYWGGAHCCFYTNIYHYQQSSRTYTRVQHFWGNVGYRLQDPNDDHKQELISKDDSFAGTFDCFACTALPIQIWSYAPTGLTNVTRAFPNLITNDLHQYLPCLPDRAPRGKDETGCLPAWAADQALLGEQNKIWPELRRSAANQNIHYPNSPAQYITALRAFLQKHGYIH
jgi:hypothetical protein